MRRADQHAAQDDQHRERHDEGAEPQLHHHEAVDEADQTADDQHRENADRRRPFEPEAETFGGQHHHGADSRRDAIDRLEREIELAGDDDKRFRQHDERQSRRGGQDRVDIPRGEENRADDGADDEQHRKRGKQRQVAQPSQGDGAGSLRDHASLGDGRGGRTLTQFKSPRPTRRARYRSNPPHARRRPCHAASPAPGRRPANLRVPHSPPGSPVPRDAYFRPRAKAPLSISRRRPPSDR